MKTSEILFVIGLLVLVMGVVIAIIPTTVETWQKKEQPLADTVITVLGGGHLFPLLNLVFMTEGSKDILVSGTVRELKGGRFDFYAFNKKNYELWVAKASYKAFVGSERCFIILLVFLADTGRCGQCALPRSGQQKPCVRLKHIRGIFDQDLLERKKLCYGLGWTCSRYDPRWIWICASRSFCGNETRLQAVERKAE